MIRALILLAVFAAVTVGTVAAFSFNYGVGQLAGRVTTTIPGFGTYIEVGDIEWQSTEPSEVPYYMTTRVQFKQSRAWHIDTEGARSSIPVPPWHLLDLHSNALAPVTVETWMR